LASTYGLGVVKRLPRGSINYIVRCAGRISMRRLSSRTVFTLPLGAGRLGGAPRFPQAGEKASVALEAATRKDPRRERTPRVDWAELLRRTFSVGVFACVRCGGRRRVLAYVKGAGGVRAILEHLGLPTASAHLAPARGPPQSAWC
jgi:hypothetical protein